MADQPQLRLYNTLTRKKETFEPIKADDVRMYVCGPTVYDYAHIGNARPVIVFDVLFRLLRHLYGDDHVTYVRNITDVDDKINARALRDHPDLPLNEAIRAVTEKTAEQFHKDVAALGCLKPTHEPRATEFVLPRNDGKSDMKSLIQSLIDRGHAYVAKGEILFDVSSMSDYGRLSNRKLEDQQAGARVAVDAHKKNPADFVLWKESSDDEPGWDATFTVNGADVTIRGRPGWHIECSAMSAAYLGETFDIHGGGLDLIFPHHENELAQSRCAHGTDVMANIWMHNGFLQVEGRKMSKSEGNFVTIRELLETNTFGGRDWPGEVIRLLMLSTHYRQPIDFSADRLVNASNVSLKWHRFSENIEEPDGRLPDPEVINALCDDLDMHGVGYHLDQLCKEPKTDDNQQRMACNLEFLGLRRRLIDTDEELRASLDQLALDQQVEKRLAFIRDKNFAEADRIRDELLAEGIQLKDGKDPETGERVTTWEVKR